MAKTSTEAELDNKKRLNEVTEKLNKLEAERAWNLSKEGKDANKRLKELQIRIKKENALLDKEAQTVDSALLIEEKRVDQAAELAKLEADIARAKTGDAADDRKADRKFLKDKRKRQKKLEDAERDWGGDLYDSIFGTYSLIGSLKNMFPKPVQILAGWGFDKIKKGISQSTKAIGKLAKGGFNALFGKKPDADAPPEVKAAAAETAAPAEVVPTETITGKKFSDSELSKAHKMGKGAAFGTHPETGEPLTEEQSTAIKEGGVVPDSVIPQETALGDEVGSVSTMGEAASAAVSMFGGGDPPAPGSDGKDFRFMAKEISLWLPMLHDDLIGILNELQKFVGPATTEGSIFTHDKSVEDKLEDQKDATEEQTDKLTTELKPEEIDSSKEGEDEQDASLIGGKTAAPGKKKKKGLFSKMKGMFGGGAGGGIGGMLAGIGKGIGALGKGIGGIGKGIGKLVQGILSGIAKGLLAFANPKILLGATFFSAAVFLIGAAIAGAAWLLGKALPTFAEGMKSFEDLDGDKLIQAGKGMAAVAAGMAAFGVGTAVAGLGALVGGITQGIVSLFGGESPLEKMQKFQEYNFDAKRIKNNADAMVAYGKGMAALGAGQGVAGLGAAVDAVGGAIAGLFGAENPLDKMKKFGEYKFDVEGIKTNAGAVKAYAEAMKDMPTAPAASVFKAAAGAIVGLLGGDTDPFAPLKKFGALKLDSKGIVTNAAAVKAYAEAMQNFPDAPAASVFTAAKDAIVGLLGGDTDPFAPLKKFGELVLNTEGIKLNAAAVKAYAEAVKDFPNSPAASVMKAAAGAIVGLLGGETDPFAPLKKFGELKLNTEQIKANAGAVKAYGEAVKDFPVAPAAGVMAAAKTAIVDLLGGDTDPFAPLKRFGEMKLNKEQIVSNSAAVVAYSNAIKDLPEAPAASVTKAAKEAIIGLLGGDTDPFAPMVRFGELKLNKEQIIANAQAVSAFGTAMSTVPEIKAERTGGLLGAIGNFFGSKKKMPWDQVKAFADADMGDATKLKENAKSLTEFGISLSGLSAIPTDIEARLKGLGNGLEEFADYINDGEIKTITEFATAMSKFPTAVMIGARPAAAGGGSVGTDDALTKMAEEATDPNANSLYVHDTHVENVLRKGFGMPTDVGATSIQPSDSILTPGNDIAAASTNMFGGGGGGINTNLVNAPTSNVRSSKTIVNLPQGRMASDPNTQKQSGYALSGWAKFD